MPPSTKSRRILCINCNVCLNTFRRYLVYELNTSVISLLSEWISPVIITEEDYICEPCNELLMRSINQQLMTSGDGAQASGLSRPGQRKVCSLCGRSTLNRQSHSIVFDNPSEEQRQINVVIQTRIAPRQMSSTDRMCHSCWMSCKRAAIRIGQAGVARGVSTTEEVEIGDSGPITAETGDSEPITAETGLESQPQPARRRLRPRHRRTSLKSSSIIFLQQWAKELERNRVQAEKKMAAATVMFAEAASKIAEASLMNAETNRMNAETNRKQFDIMKAIMDVVGQPGQPSSARFCAKDHSENEVTVFCPKCKTEVLQTLRPEEARNTDKRQEPPDKRRRARKRSRQTDSSSESDSSDHNDDDNELSSNCHVEEPEIEAGPTAVKVEPIDIEVHKEQADTDPISLDVKTEPRDDEVNNTNETHELNEPTGTKSKGRKNTKKKK